MMYKTLRTIHDKYGNRIKKGSVVGIEQLGEITLERFIQKGYLTQTEETPLETFDKEIKLCIVTGMWKRPEVFKIFGQHYKDLGIDVIVSGSEGDKSKQLAESFGFIYLERPNQPLSAKMNSTLIEGLKRDYTHFICVGSDDLLSKELIDEYTRLIRLGYDFIGLLDFYFYELGTGKASYWAGYRKERRGETVGAGRVLSRKLLESWNGKAWNDRDRKYLDKAMQHKINQTQFPKHVFKLKDKGLLAVDLKSSENLTPFKIWKNSYYIEPQKLQSEFNIKRVR